MSTERVKGSDPLPRIVAWSAVIIASALPTIIWRESGRGPDTPGGDD